MCEELTEAIQNSYEQGIGMEDAERLAGKFLHAQILVSEEIQKVDLDKRMKKSGVKAVKAAVYLEEAGKGDRKPSDTFLNAKVDINELVVKEHDSLDAAESYYDYLENTLSVMREAHLHFRGIAKARFT